MSEIEIFQQVLQCPSCAGQRRFDPVHQGMLCNSCGAYDAIVWPEGHNADHETPYLPDIPAPEAPVLTETQAHACSACGGSVLFVGAALSDHCPYCNGPVVLGVADAGYTTMALIPFQADRDFALRQALGWAGKRIAAPSDLQQAVKAGRTVGLYAPFWTFDSSEALRYWAKYTTGSGKNRRTHSTQGHMQLNFDDLLMPASLHVTPLLRDGVLHDFDPQSLVPFDPRYIAGFAAERHHQSVADGLRANDAEKDTLIRNRIRRKINRSGVHAVRYKTDTTGIHYRRILLPMWITHYDYAGKSYRIVVSGIDGRTFGERPFSKAKLLALSGALTALAMGIGLVWGATGLL